MSAIRLECIARGKWAVVREEDSAAGYRCIEASNREQANQAATLLRQEEARAIAIERIKVKFHEV